MNKLTSIIILAVSLLALPPSGLSAAELKEIKTSEQLARFIYDMSVGQNLPRELIRGIKSKESIRISGEETAIPVREIFGAIIDEKYGDQLASRLYKKNNRYDTRAICSFADYKGEVWRFRIMVFNKKQYGIMRQYLEQLQNEISKKN
jgi:hypothetical protein